MPLQLNEVYHYAAVNSTSETAEDSNLQIPLYAVILVVFGIIAILAYLFCFFCVPSTNKRKIYAMMKEAKLEDEGHM